MGNRHGHRTAGADIAGDIKRRLPGIPDRAVADAHRIPIGAIAGALLGHDQNAPVSIEALLAGDIGADEAGSAAALRSAKAVKAEAAM